MPPPSCFLARTCCCLPSPVRLWQHLASKESTVPTCADQQVRSGCQDFRQPSRLLLLIQALATVAVTARIHALATVDMTARSKGAIIVQAPVMGASLLVWLCVFVCSGCAVSFNPLPPPLWAATRKLLKQDPHKERGDWRVPPCRAPVWLRHACLQRDRQAMSLDMRKYTHADARPQCAEACHRPSAAPLKDAS